MCQHADSSSSPATAALVHARRPDIAHSCSCSCSSCSYSQRCECDECNADCAPQRSDAEYTASPTSPSCCSPSSSPSLSRSPSPSPESPTSSSSSYATTHDSTSPCISLGDIEQRGRLYSATSGIHLPESTTPLLTTPLLSFDVGTLLPPVLAHGNSTTASDSAFASASAASPNAASSSIVPRDSSSGSGDMRAPWGKTREVGGLTGDCFGNGRIAARGGDATAAATDRSVGRSNTTACPAASFRRIVGFSVKEGPLDSPRKLGDIEDSTGPDGGSAAGHRREAGMWEEDQAPGGAAPASAAEAQAAEASGDQAAVRERLAEATKVNEEMKSLALARVVAGSQQAQNPQQQAEQRPSAHEPTPVARWWAGEEGGGRKAREESCLTGRHGEAAMRRDAKRASRLRY